MPFSPLRTPPLRTPPSPLAHRAPPRSPPLRPPLPLPHSRALLRRRGQRPNSGARRARGQGARAAALWTGQAAAPSWTRRMRRAARRKRRWRPACGAGSCGCGSAPRWLLRRLRRRRRWRRSRARLRQRPRSLLLPRGAAGRAGWGGWTGRPWHLMGRHCRARPRVAGVRAGRGWGGQRWRCCAPGPRRRARPLRPTWRRSGLP